MTPEVFLTDILDPGCAFLAELGGPPQSDNARQFLLCVALTESGPKLDARYQNSPSTSRGPANGWLQFEQGGGVHGVMTHQASTALARTLCDALHVVWNEPAVWRAIEGHDLLSIGFGRLLLWTDPGPLPTTEEAAWQCYAERLWRPGAPHRDVWHDNWGTASAAVAANPIA